MKDIYFVAFLVIHTNSSLDHDKVSESIDLVIKDEYIPFVIEQVDYEDHE